MTSGDGIRVRVEGLGKADDSFFEGELEAEVLKAVAHCWVGDLPERVVDVRVSVKLGEMKR